MNCFMLFGYKAVRRDYASICALVLAVLDFPDGMEV